MIIKKRVKIAPKGKGVDWDTAPGQAKKMRRNTGSQTLRPSIPTIGTKPVDPNMGRMIDTPKPGGSTRANLATAKERYTGLSATPKPTAVKVTAIKPVGAGQAYTPKKKKKI
jgi:hypothetical protein